MKKSLKKIIALVLTLIMVFSVFCQSVFAASVTGLPDNMLDSYILRALEYTGYDVDAQKTNGTLYDTNYISSRTPSSVLSNISYGTSTTGFETVEDSGTKTGLAPNIKKFEQSGLCCASFVTYYICNYLPNVEGVDTQFITDAVKATGMNSQAVETWQKAMDSLVSQGKIEKIGTSRSNVDRTKLTPGDIITYGNSSDSGVHAAIYAGTYNGEDYTIHVGNERGPEISLCRYMEDASNGSKQSSPNAYYHLPEDIFKQTGKIEINKSDTDGNKLFGAYFVATSATDSSEQFLIGPTNSSGYAVTEDIPYGTYKVKETVFPTNYRSYGQTEWNVTVDSNNDGKVTINAVNEIIPGNVKLVKTSEDGIIEGVSFKIEGNGVNKNVTTGKTGEVLIENLKPGTYKVTETVASRYESQEIKNITVVTGQTTTVTFNNMLKRGSLKVTKTAEDNKISGHKFKLSGTSLSGEKVELYATTNASGIASFNNVLITGTTPYVLEEVETNNRYIVPAKQNVSIEWNKVTNKTVNNVLKRGSLKVTKTSEDGELSGHKFKLSGTALSGENVQMYATTNANGIAMFEDFLISGSTPYVLEEVETKEKYIVPQNQNVTINWNEVTNKSVYNELKRGSLKVTKTCEDGLVSGHKFKLSGTSLSGEKIELYATTNTSGIAIFEDVLITGNTPYVLEEVETKEKYVVPDKQNVVIEWNKETNKSVYNKLKRGDLTVTKTAEDGLAEGLKFRLTGTSLSGSEVNVTATTDSNGKAIFKDILIGSNYTIEEINTPIRYVIPSSQKTNIEWNKVTNKSFENILKKFRIDAVKKDKETENSQGDATLEGAVYGLYKNGTLLKSYTTDKNGCFVTDYYTCGTGYYLQEITPSEGYLLDTEKYNISCSADLYTVELNTVKSNLFENVIKGKICIVKHTDDGETQIETPEKGAQFQIYLKSSGSFDSAKEKEKDLITIDEQGFATTKELPYGIYTVHQTKGWEGREKVKDFDVEINQNGFTYKYIINNSAFRSYLKIVKTDSTTGKVIPCAGAGFKLFDPEGNQIVMKYTYPTLTVIDTFYTSADGTLITPERLLYGKGYSLVEVQANEGYVLDSTPVYFDITEENSSSEQDITVINVTKENNPQMGIINVTKSGEVFYSVVEKDGIFTPVYKSQGLKDAEYTVTAVEDIITPDGTKRYSKGEIVDVITTDESGLAKTRELFLGKYSITETKAPYGMVLNNEPNVVELKYAGQEISVTEESTSFYNERQKVVLDLLKIIEKDETFKKGISKEIKKVSFGLFADERLIALDRSEIPKDGLFETAYCDENGKVAFSADIPVGAKLYVKELTTDENYIISEEKYPVEFIYAGDKTATVTLTFNSGENIENKLIRGRVEGQKTDEDKVGIEGVEFGLFFSDTEEFTKENAILISVTDNTGKFEFANLPFGKWMVKEISAPVQFVLSDKIFEIEIKENGEIIEIAAENKFVKGNIQIRKTDADTGELLSGAVFEVYKDVNGNKTYDKDIDTLVDKLTETDNGIYLLNNLRYGGYFVYESESPEFYLKNDEYYYFEILKNSETVTVETGKNKGFQNISFKGNVKIFKRDIETGELLSSATFEVYKDINGNKMYDKDIDTVVGELKETEKGTYLLENLRFGGYFICETKSPDYYLKNENYFYFEILNNGETILIETSKDKGFENIPFKGSIKVIKKDAKTGKRLEGVLFGLYDSSGKEITRGTTDKNGELVFNDLRVGEYLIRELETIDDYIKNDIEFKAKIKENGQEIVAEFTNEKIPESPKTGDARNLLIYEIAMFLSALSLIILIINKRRSFNQ